VAKLERDLGPILMQALLEPSTIEVMVNADGRIWQESLGMPMKAIGTLAAAKTEAIIKTVAGFHNKEATALKPMIEGELRLKPPPARCRVLQAHCRRSFVHRYLRFESVQPQCFH